MKKLFLFAAAALALASCSETDELALNQVAQQSEKGGIQFDVYTQRGITRAGAPGGYADGLYGLTTKTLKEGSHAKYGFGVFAYYTSNSEYDTNSSTPNFMYNQQVVWDKTKTVWTYEPVKYWPNEFGNAAESDDFDKVTFFAYAPWTEFTVNTGVPVVKDGEKADSVQKKNIVGTVKNSASGDPYIKYIVDTDPATSVDLLWGVAADLNGYRGLNYDGRKSDGNVIPGDCYIDLTKQIGTTDSIRWNFKHALAQLNIQIISAVDTATQGDEIYTPKAKATEYGTNANSKIDSLTKVYLRWIEFGGFVMKGALNLHSEDVETPGVAYAEPNWKGFDGTNELVIEPVRFNDGLKDGKEGTTNNVQKNELPVALNKVLIEQSMESQIEEAKAAGEEEPENTWKYKKPGIPTAAYANLFQSSDPNTKADAPIYVIPTGEELTIEMLYDVLTQDESLAGLLSDNKTHGIGIENKINKETGVILEAGKSYIIKIVVGLESVKFSVEVTEWVDADPKETDVDMPFNPGYKAQYDEATNLPTVLYQYADVENDKEFDVPTMFNKLFITKIVNAPGDTTKVDTDFEDYYYFGTEFQYRVKKADLKINKKGDEGEPQGTVVETYNKETQAYEAGEEEFFFNYKYEAKFYPGEEVWIYYTENGQRKRSQRTFDETLLTDGGVDYLTWTAADGNTRNRIPADSKPKSALSMERLNANTNEWEPVTLPGVDAIYASKDQPWANE